MIICGWTTFVGSAWVLLEAQKQFEQEIDLRSVGVCVAVSLLAKGNLTTTSQTDFLRKEVIQPHLPIRLPCYDFVPLAPHTFGGWLP